MNFKIFILLLFSLSIYATGHRYTNSLSTSTSPYLLQHAHNPINWYEWNKESFAKAQKENKLIFLSIGYSTCHWCHVMEKESFQNEVLAKLFNEYYISIKVDREIHSDLDLYYQEILSSLKTRRNGWPLSVIMTPDLKVLYIATYIPPTFNYGVEGLDTLLQKYAKIYKDKKALQKLISVHQEKINNSQKFSKKDQTNLEKQFLDASKEVYDDDFKGFFKTPRFPHSSNINLLFDIYHLTKDKTILPMIYEPLTVMANGGIYDQVEGAFFRYSVHQDWIIPHYEKMLYTTAELIPIYVKAYQDTQNPLYKKIVRQSLEQIEQRFLKNGLFFSASNADSDGLEGRYFVYSYNEVKELLVKNGYTQKEIEENLEYLDIASVGNFEEDLSNPHFNNNLGDDIAPKKLEQTLELLKEIRETREYPFIDKKVISSWNAMMITAFLKAGEISKIYEAKGLNYLDTLLKNLYINDTLYHFKIGDKPLKEKALLEDYSFLIETLLVAYEKTYNENYLTLAKKFSKKAQKKFLKNNIWYLSSQSLGVKGNFIDKYYSSALSKILSVNLTIALFSDDRKLYNQTKQQILGYKDQILSNIAAHPSGVKLLLRIQKGDIVIKSKKSNLLKIKQKIKTITYPFLFTKVQIQDDFLACDINSCFAYDKEFKKIQEVILKRLQ